MSVYIQYILLKLQSHIMAHSENTNRTGMDYSRDVRQTNEQVIDTNFIKMMGTERFSGGND